MQPSRATRRRTKVLRAATLFAVAALLQPARLAAQSPAVERTEVVHRTPGDTLNDSYRVYLPGSRPRAVVVLLPGYGGTVDDFQPDGFTPSSLPARLAGQGIATVVAVPMSATLFADEDSLRRLDAIVTEVLTRFAAPAAPVAVGGFSAGGTGAVRYAERCAARACGGGAPVAAVFAVDAPLDFARLWYAADLALRRRSPRANAAEARSTLADLRRALGGDPQAAASAYRRRSPLLAQAVDGGNARWLRGTPTRLFTEPDVQWWLENRQADYTSMNATDAAALVNVLRLAGNAEAQLVTTSGRGVRPNGTRHPHSWSIVDEAELTSWLLARLAP